MWWHGEFAKCHGTGPKIFFGMNRGKGRFAGRWPCGG